MCRGREGQLEGVGVCIRKGGSVRRGGCVWGREGQLEGVGMCRGREGQLEGWVCVGEGRVS